MGDKKWLRKIDPLPNVESYVFIHPVFNRSFKRLVRDDNYNDDDSGQWFIVLMVMIKLMMMMTNTYDDNNEDTVEHNTLVKTNSYNENFMDQLQSC